MSADAPTQRELAYRLFATEYDDADYSYSESDEERAPNYVVTPTGARVNRLFVAGVLTEVEQVSDDVLRARVVDPTGAFVLYAGQYQPDEQAFLERIATPTFVAVTGKARTFTPDDADAVYTSLRPESINEVDATTRDRWTVQAAEQTLDRIHDIAVAMATDLTGESLHRELENRGLDAARANGITRALEQYETTPMYLDSLVSIAVDAARVVAGRRDEIQNTTPAPDARGEVTVATLLDTLDGFGTISSETPDATTTSGPAPAGGERERPTAETHADVTETPAEESVKEGSSPDTGQAVTPDSGHTGAPDTEPTTATETPSSSGSQKSDSSPVSASSDGVDSTGESSSDTAIGDKDPVVDPDQEEYDLPEETREEIEAEYGTDFQSGTEVPEPGEADIETPDDTPTEEPAVSESSDAGADRMVDESEDAGADRMVDESEDAGADRMIDESENTNADRIVDESKNASDTAPRGRQASGTDTTPTEQPAGETETTPKSESVNHQEAVGGVEDVGSAGEDEREAPGGESGEPGVDSGGAGAVTTGEESPQVTDSSEDGTPPSEGAGAETEPTDDEGTPVDEDPQDLVLSVMVDLNDGDGVERTALVDTTMERSDLTADEVEEAIQDALMDGQCYEPDETTLKPI